MKKYLLVGSVVAVSSLFPLKAQAIDYVYSPNTHKGELELEYNGSTTFDGNADKNNKQEHETELEYGLTDRLTLRIEGEYEKEPNESFRSSELGFGGRYQFFEQGEYWLDSGLLFNYEHVLEDGHADEIKALILLEKQTGPFLHRTNFGIEQEVGRYSQGGPERLFSWNSRYLLNEHLQPGFEIQSNFGKGSDHPRWSDQEHYAGPAIFGNILPNFKYEAAYYFGLTEAASTGAARIKLEYEIYF